MKKVVENCPLNLKTRTSMLKGSYPRYCVVDRVWDKFSAFHDGGQKVKTPSITQYRRKKD
jgi:hypothetical protein